MDSTKLVTEEKWISVVVQSFARLKPGERLENEDHFLFEIEGDKFSSIRAYLETQKLHDLVDQT